MEPISNIIMMNNIWLVGWLVTHVDCLPLPRVEASQPHQRHLLHYLSASDA
uniref:Uncharacterized protein n=1 Tax=Ciona intestinalis TaxID=7719 RepID=H2XN96_CIOIN